jgi:prepilin-type N-terminal cleavage/methylation domain-containing protein/prepilin-type processing-associated H-X9-DG protein
MATTGRRSVAADRGVGSSIPTGPRGERLIVEAIVSAERSHPDLLRQRDRCLPSERAFTLLEVLVVVAIISLLVAILLPSLAKARWQTRHLLCQTDLANLGKAWHEYLVDSRGWFPKSQVAADNAEINYGGRQGSGDSTYCGKKPLNRYLGLPLVTDAKAEVFRCPFDGGSASVQPSCFEYFGSSYLMNHMLVGQPKLVITPRDPCKMVLKQVSARIGTLNSSQVGNESKLLLVGDYGWYNAWERQLPFEDAIEWHAQRMRHNITFMDGHVGFTRIRKGVHATGDYTVIPFIEQQVAVTVCQQEVTCP